MVTALSVFDSGPPEILNLEDLIVRPAFFHHGACKDHPQEWWFPIRGGSPTPAKAICAQCPVRVECLQWALDHGEYHGMWGGKSERQRRYLRHS
jgi:WhiB family redox-sensing transcriptional regulator